MTQKSRISRKFQILDLASMECPVEHPNMIQSYQLFIHTVSVSGKRHPIAQKSPDDFRND